ncbi:MAG TPA: hypothetical protein VGM37_15410 [Armatimonadota bacterium]|jgi:hypothetical protein
MHIPQNPDLHKSPPDAISIETRILGWGAQRVDVPLPEPSIRVADFIRLKIGVEWELFQTGQRDRVGLESASPEALMAPAAAPDQSLDEALFAALDGYRAGWYVILVDGAQTGGLDERITLSPSSDVRFVRVYPLPDARGG